MYRRLSTLFYICIFCCVITVNASHDGRPFGDKVAGIGAMQAPHKVNLEARSLSREQEAALSALAAVTPASTTLLSFGPPGIVLFFQVLGAAAIGGMLGLSFSDSDLPTPFNIWAVVTQVVRKVSSETAARLGDLEAKGVEALKSLLECSGADPDEWPMKWLDQLLATTQEFAGGNAKQDVVALSPDAHEKLPPKVLDWIRERTDGASIPAR